MIFKVRGGTPQSRKSSEKVSKKRVFTCNTVYYKKEQDKEICNTILYYNFGEDK